MSDNETVVEDDDRGNDAEESVFTDIRSQKSGMESEDASTPGS